MKLLKPSRPVLRYHGGKWRLAEWVIGYLPPHRIYVEPFAGAASVLMKKAPAQFCEVINDLNGEIVNLFSVLRDAGQAESLRHALEFTPYSRKEFVLSYEPCDDPLEQARRTVVRAFQGFGSDSANGARTGFRANGNRSNTHPVVDFAHYPRCMRAFTRRLSGVVIECRPAVEIIRQHDAPGTLFYCDPPYLHSTRSKAVVRAGKGYGEFEMSDAEHRNLAKHLRAAKGMVVLSGYACSLYDQELYGDWHRVESQVLANHKKITEVLWINDAAWGRIEKQAQLDFMGVRG